MDMPETTNYTPPKRRTNTTQTQDIKRKLRQKQIRRRNKMIKLFVIRPLCVVLAVVALYFLLRLVGLDIFDRSGWDTGKNGTRRYLDYSGEPLTGWQTLEDGQLCYFSNSGILQTGLFRLNGKAYYWEDGIKSGWVTIDGVEYYIQPDLAVKTGWIDRSGALHYYHEDGTAAIGWTDIGKHRYYFNEKGQMQTGWLTLEGDTYYLKEDGRMAKGQVTLDEVNYFFTSQGKQILLVNQWNAVPEDYQTEMTEFEGFRAASVCVEALGRMVSDGRSNGHRCSIDNIYRSKEEQNYLWWRKFHELKNAGYSEPDAAAKTSTSLMPMGHSEHHTGLAVDFVDTQTDSLNWLNEHCWEYGFIVRYPDGKTEFTGIIYEPWHYRYVGVELAQELKTLGISLEEYMMMLTAENNEEV